MPTEIYIYCPSGEDGAIRGELEDDVEEFFGPAAEFVGGGGGVPGFNLDFELADGEDVESWVVRLRDFLKRADTRPGTFFEVFPDDWEPGRAWRRIDLRGGDRWLTERDPRACYALGSITGASLRIMSPANASQCQPSSTRAVRS